MKSKKIISLLLSFCLVFSFAPIAALAEDASGFPHHLGDVDNDGKITAFDARIALRISANLEEADEETYKSADYDGNGNVEASDARRILRVSARLDRPADNKPSDPSATNPSDHTHNLTDWITEKEATVSQNGLRVKKCTICGETIESEVIPYIDPNEGSIVADFKVLDGQVVNAAGTDAKITGAAVSGEYFNGGSISLESQLADWTFQMIVDYNEESDKGVINYIQYGSTGDYVECDNVFRLEELIDHNNVGIVRTAWVPNAYNTGYVMSVPIEILAHNSGSREFFPTGDSFWSFSTDTSTGEVNFRIDGKSSSSTIPERSDAPGTHISKILPGSFSLNADHSVKEIKIYNKALTDEEKSNAYKAAEIALPEKSINKVADGLTDLGSSLAYVKDSEGVMTWYDTEKTAGQHTISEFSRPVTYNIKDFVQPDLGIDNSAYESVHITNNPKTLFTGKQYPLTAYPYPYDPFGGKDGKSMEFDITWSTSDSSVAAVIDGLIIAKKAGSVDITATLTGSSISDTITITIVDKAIPKDKVWEVPSDYVSKNGCSFSDTDYQMTTRAIYDAIDEASENGYNHIVFPKQDFYAVPLLDDVTHDGYRYFVPSNMTVEFPEGSAFHMMESDVSKVGKVAVDLRYFTLGVPADNYTDSCENSHIIVDKYYGERYETESPEDSFLEENCFAYIGRKAVDCTVEVHKAYSPAGYFIGVDGTGNLNTSAGVMTGNNFTSGRLNDSGEIETNDKWVSTKDFITVPDYGSDGYFLSDDGQEGGYAQKYRGGCSARVYDIEWFDENKNIILAERYLGRGEYYEIPENAAFFKISLLQSGYPDDASPWLALHDDGSAKMCEIKNTEVFNSACGVFSVVGETDGLWVHDCYTDGNGKKPGNERTGDFENGWLAMRHSVVSNNFLLGYFGAPGGYNTFIHTNFISDFSSLTGENEMFRYINNTTQSVELSEKQQAHIYYNILNAVYVDRFGKSLGQIYDKGNIKNQNIYSY